MDQLISQITEKTGLPSDKVEQVVGMVVSFLSDKLPAPIASQVTGLLEGGDAAGGATDAAGGAMDAVKKGLGGLLGN